MKDERVNGGSSVRGAFGAARSGTDELAEEIERISVLFRAHLDTLCETARATRAVEGLDRANADRQFGIQLKLSAPLWILFSEKLTANGIALSGEDSQPGQRRGDSQPGRKRTP